MIIIENLSLAQGGTATSATGWNIEQKTGEHPIIFYRKIFYLRFLLNNNPDKIAINQDSTELQVAFASLEYNSAAPGAEADITPYADSFIVDLKTAPGYLSKININNANVSQVEIYRVDGNRLMSDPTLTINNNTTISEEFVAARFAVKAKKSNGDQIQFTKDEIQAINIISYPTGPRIGLADPAKPEGAIFFRQEPGLIKPADISDTFSLNASTAFAEALQGYLNRYFEENNQVDQQHIDIALIVESDAQCSFSLSRFAVYYSPALTGFRMPDGQKSDKIVLRFAKDKIESHNINIKVPLDFTEAEVSLEPSFGNNPPLLTAKDLPGNENTLNQGVYINNINWAALPVQPEKAGILQGIYLYLLPLNIKTEIIIELQEDWQGEPSGKILQTCQTTMRQTGERESVLFRFAQELPLNPGSYWILLKASSGTAVWLAGQGKGRVKFFAKQQNSLQKESFNSLADTQPVYNLIFKRQKNHFSCLQLSIKDNIINPEPDDKNRYNLKNSIAQYLNSKPGDNTLADVPLTFTATGPGLVTVYAPVIK